MRYAARIFFDKESQTYGIVFPDVHGAQSFGTSVEDALAHGRDALLTILDVLRERGEPMPVPTTEGQHFVDVPDPAE